MNVLLTIVCDSGWIDQTPFVRLIFSRSSDIKCIKESEED